MQLEEDEEIILEDALADSRKLTLTNKRLIYERQKGFFDKTWMIDCEIKLEEIGEAYLEPQAMIADGSRALLRMKNQEVIDLGLTSKNLEKHDDEIRNVVMSKAMADSGLAIKWVKTINSVL